jgi:hypothetical protein
MTGVFVNGTQVQYSLLPSSNHSLSYLYFTYNHSTEQITIMQAHSVSQGNSYIVLFVVAVIIIVPAISFLVIAMMRRKRKRNGGAVYVLTYV